MKNKYITILGTFGTFSNVDVLSMIRFMQWDVLGLGCFVTGRFMMGRFAMERFECASRTSNLYVFYALEVLVEQNS
jgi:hypothetical protein